jgi:hypothetical protein
MPERRTIMDLLYAMRDLNVTDPAADRTSEETVRTALAQEIDKAAIARRPARLRHNRPRLLAGATIAVAASATVVTLLLGAAASPPPAFAVTTDPNGATTITLNALSAVSALNAKLAATGLHVRVAPVVAGCNDPVQSVGSAAAPATLQAQPQVGANSMQLSPTAAPGSTAHDVTNVPTGHTLVLAASKSGLQVVGQIDQSTAPACVGLASGQ